MTDVSTAIKTQLREYERYLDDIEPTRGVDDYFYDRQPLNFREWSQREDPCDPDLDA